MGPPPSTALSRVLQWFNFYTIYDFLKTLQIDIIITRKHHKQCSVYADNYVYYVENAQAYKNKKKFHIRTIGIMQINSMYYLKCSV